jgi:hypothetical protein
MPFEPKTALVLFVGASILSVTLWLGIQSLVIFTDGNKDPSLPLSTPCPELNNSMMPYQYKMDTSWGWHMRTYVGSSRYNSFSLTFAAGT